MLIKPLLILAILHISASEKLRICVVDGRGGFKKAAKYCPILDRPESQVECVVGIDRLDCLRRISKSKVDFSLFTPEDLVAATNSEVNVLLTNQMKFTKDEYEYEVVAIVSDDSGIKSTHDLRGTRFCHPGYGYATDWTNILANFLESTVTPQECDPRLTLAENRIKASSKFFKAACKAGPWVNDHSRDTELKRKYPNLCDLCNSPGQCSIQDKYWGRRGPLFCLTDGVGDVAWARLDDVKLHFGAFGIPKTGYSYLCKDGTKIPLDSEKKPCIWVAKPWPVVAARSKKAQEIQTYLNSINQNQPNPWQTALMNLMQVYKQEMVPLNPIQPIESYMERSPGFLSANSFAGCHPPRTIRICTTTNVENSKCAWMREAAAVYGVEPDLDCVKAANLTHCMEAIGVGAADVLLVPPDYLNLAQKRYNLKSFIYETANDTSKYLTVAFVKNKSRLKNLADFEGAKVCFPNYDGIAWNSVRNQLRKHRLIDACPNEESFVNFFKEVNAQNLPEKFKGKSSLYGDQYHDEYGVIRCVGQGLADVGFLSENSLQNFFQDAREYGDWHLNDFRILCPEELDDCKFSWSVPGYLMAHQKKSQLWIKDTINVFLQLDTLFGRSYESLTLPFALYDLFDGWSNVLFHDATVRLRTVPYLNKPQSKTNGEQSSKDFEDLLNETFQCSNSTTIVLSSYLLFITSLVVYVIPTMN